MSGSVTVPGVASGTSITLPFVGTANLALATQIANALDQARNNNTLDVQNYSGGPFTAVPGGDTTLELLLASNVSGSISVPAAAAGITEVLVLQNNTQALTIHGSANLSIIGGGPGALTIDDPNVVDIGANVGSTGTVSMTFSAADSPYQVVMGQGFETVNAGGSGTITGGSGPDVINISGPNDIIESGSDGTTVNAVGFASSIDGSNGVLTVNDAGYLDTITGGALFATAVTTSGFRADVIGGSNVASTLNVLDNGFRDTIQAGAGLAAVTLAGFDGLALGGSALLNVSVAGGTGDTVGFGSGGGTFASSSLTSGALVFASSGEVDVNDTGTSDTIVGNTGPLLVTSAGALGVIFGEGASSFVDHDSGDKDTVVAGSGLNTVTTSSSNAIVFGETGSLLFSNALAAAGSADTVIGNSGATTVQGNTVLVFGPGGTFNITDQGTNDTVVAGAGTGTVHAAGNNELMFGETGTFQFIGGAGLVTIVGSSGNGTVAGGSGGTTLFGGAGGVLTFTNSGVGALTYSGRTGDETVNASGSSTNDVLTGGHDTAGANSIVGGSGNDTLVAGTGSDTLVGNASSHDLFVFFSANGSAAATDSIVNFGSNDLVLLSGYGASAAGAALAGATFAGGNTTLTLSDHTTITFVGVSNTTTLEGHIVST
jgi:hypothetical protein